MHSQQNKELSNTGEELAGCGPALHPPEAGGRGEEKGANLAPERASPTKLQTGFQFLTKDFLRFWLVGIRREGRSQKSAPQKRHKAHRTGRTQKLRRGWGGEKSHCT